MPAPIWQMDLPIHTSAVLKLQQDEKTKINCAMLLPGYGITGGGLANYAGDNAPLSPNGHLLAANQGLPRPDVVYKFSNITDIPRRASLSLVLSLSEWARALLQALAGPNTFASIDIDGQQILIPTMHGITAVLYGRRLVQQRGALRA